MPHTNAANSRSSLQQHYTLGFKPSLSVNLDRFFKSSLSNPVVVTPSLGNNLSYQGASPFQIKNSYDNSVDFTIDLGGGDVGPQGPPGPQGVPGPPGDDGDDGVCPSCGSGGGGGGGCTCTADNDCLTKDGSDVFHFDNNIDNTNCEVVKKEAAPGGCTVSTTAYDGTNGSDIEFMVFPVSGDGLNGDPFEFDTANDTLRFQVRRVKLVLERSTCGIVLDAFVKDAGVEEYLVSLGECDT